MIYRIFQQFNSSLLRCCTRAESTSFTSNLHNTTWLHWTPRRGRCLCSRCNKVLSNRLINGNGNVLGAAALCLSRSSGGSRQGHAALLPRESVVLRAIQCCIFSLFSRGCLMGSLLIFYIGLLVGKTAQVVRANCWWCGSGFYGFGSTLSIR